MAAVPWWTVALTAAVTTTTGYVVIEVIKSIHRAILRRRQEAEDELTAANPQPKKLPPVGMRMDGTFNLPTPDHEFPAQHAKPRPYSSFAAPAPMGPPPGTASDFDPQTGQYRHPLTDVSTPVGQLRHELKAVQHNVEAVQHNVDARLARIEHMLAQHYQQEVG